MSDGQFDACLVAANQMLDTRDWDGVTRVLVDVLATTSFGDAEYDAVASLIALHNPELLLAQCIIRSLEAGCNNVVGHALILMTLTGDSFESPEAIALLRRVSDRLLPLLFALFQADEVEDPCVPELALETIIAIDPTNVPALVYAAEREQDPRRKLAAYQDILALDPQHRIANERMQHLFQTDPMLIANRAVEAFQAQAYREAETLLLQAFAMRPNLRHERFGWTLGQVYQALGQEEKSIEAFEQSLIGSRSMYELITIYRQRGEAARKANDTKLALDYFNRMLSLAKIRYACFRSRTSGIRGYQVDRAKHYVEGLRQAGQLYTYTYTQDGPVPDDPVLRKRDYRVLAELSAAAKSYAGSHGNAYGQTGHVSRTDQDEHETQPVNVPASVGPVAEQDVGRVALREAFGIGRFLDRVADPGIEAYNRQDYAAAETLLLDALKMVPELQQEDLGYILAQVYLALGQEERYIWALEQNLPHWSSMRELTDVFRKHGKVAQAAGDIESALRYFNQMLSLANIQVHCYGVKQPGGRQHDLMRANAYLAQLRQEGRLYTYTYITNGSVADDTLLRPQDYRTLQELSDLWDASCK